MDNEEEEEEEGGAEENEEEDEEDEEVEEEGGSIRVLDLVHGRLGGGSSTPCPLSCPCS